MWTFEGCWRHRTQALFACYERCNVSPFAMSIPLDDCEVLFKYSIDILNQHFFFLQHKRPLFASFLGFPVTADCRLDSDASSRPAFGLASAGKVQRLQRGKKVVELGARWPDGNE